MHRVKGEQGAGELRAGHTERAKDAPEQCGIERVEADVDQGVAYGVQSPRVLLGPERGEDQRIVLGRRTGREPDAPQAAQVRQGGIVRDVLIVIPDKTAEDRGDIGDLVLGRSQTLGFGCLWHSGPPLCPTAQPGAAGPHLLAGLGAMEH